MVTGKTSTGFDFEIDSEVLDDMEVIELMAAATDNMLLLPDLLKALLGADQKAALYEHARGENGRVKASAIERECSEIIGFMSSAVETKNS